MGWLFEETIDDIETLEDCIICFILHIYREFDGPYVNPSKIDDDAHVYWTHLGVRTNPDSLQDGCVEVIRREMFTASHGYSIIPRIKQLPLPEAIKAMLTLQ